MHVVSRKLHDPPGVVSQPAVVLEQVDEEHLRGRPKTVEGRPLELEVVREAAGLFQENLPTEQVESQFSCHQVAVLRAAVLANQGTSLGLVPDATSFPVSGRTTGRERCKTFTTFCGFA